MSQKGTENLALVTNLVTSFGNLLRAMHLPNSSYALSLPVLITVLRPGSLHDLKVAIRNYKSGLKLESV